MNVLGLSDKVKKETPRGGVSLIGMNRGSDAYLMIFIVFYRGKIMIVS